MSIIFNLNNMGQIKVVQYLYKFSLVQRMGKNPVVMDRIETCYLLLISLFCDNRVINIYEVAKLEFAVYI